MVQSGWQAHNSAGFGKAREKNMPLNHKITGVPHQNISGLTRVWPYSGSTDSYVYTFWLCIREVIGNTKTQQISSEIRLEKLKKCDFVGDKRFWVYISNSAFSFLQDIVWGCQPWRHRSVRLSWRAWLRSTRFCSKSVSWFEFWQWTIGLAHLLESLPPCQDPWPLTDHRVTSSWVSITP